MDARTARMVMNVEDFNDWANAKAQAANAAFAHRDADMIFWMMVANGIEESYKENLK